MEQNFLPALICAPAFILIHLFSMRLRFLHVIPRSKWLSIAGGSSIAYVFVHLLPELSVIIGMGYKFPEILIASVFAFIAGGIILNVLKEELPAERESNSPAFWFGIIIYTTLISIFS